MKKSASRSPQLQQTLQQIESSWENWHKTCPEPAVPVRDHPHPKLRGETKELLQRLKQQLEMLSESEVGDLTTRCIAPEK